MAIYEDLLFAVTGLRHKAQQMTGCYLYVPSQFLIFYIFPRWLQNRKDLSLVYSQRVVGTSDPVPYQSTEFPPFF